MKTIDGYGKTKEELVDGLVKFLEDNGLLRIIEINNPVNPEIKYYATLTIDERAANQTHLNAIKK